MFQRFPECARSMDEGCNMPLHIACQTGALDIVMLLLTWNYPSGRIQTFVDRSRLVEFCHSLNLNAENGEEKTPLYLACEGGHEDVVKFLLSYNVRGRRLEGAEGGDREPTSLGSGDENEDDIPDFCPVLASLDDSGSVKSVDVESEGSVIYTRVHAGNVRTSCIHIAVKNGSLSIVRRLIKAGASVELLGIQNDLKYSVLLMAALDNSDLLMLNLLLDHGAKDENNIVFKVAVKSKPSFVGHFLKYKASEDKQNGLNKLQMRKSFHESTTSIDPSDPLSQNDPRYYKIFPKEAVNIRWQNLKVLQTIDKDWLNTTVYFLNPTLSHINMSNQYGLFAITRVDVSHNELSIVPESLLQLPSLVSLTLSDNQITEFPSTRNFEINCPWIEEINVQNNKLKTIPDYVFLMPKLKLLNASNNKIEALPMSMWDAPYLKSMDLSRNEIRGLPRPMVSIRSDSESSNDSIKPPFMPLSRSFSSHVISHELKRANHWSEHLTVNDEDVRSSQHTGLVTLKLNRNKMEKFPEFLSCVCTRLENLEINHNKLTGLGNIASYPRSLKQLDLSYNEIETMLDWQQEDGQKRCFFISRK